MAEDQAGRGVDLPGTLGKFPGILRETTSTTRLFGLALLVILVAIVFLAVFGLPAEAELIGLVLAGAIVVVLLCGAFVEARSGGHAHAASQARAPEPPAKWVAYIAAPMEGLDSDVDYNQHREHILRVKDALRKHCDVDTCFYAGIDITTKKEFNEPHIALVENLKELRRSKRFIMFVPKRVASSILFEAGMALALGKPSTWFVREGVELPYLMRGAPGASGDDLPLVRIYRYASVDDLLRKIEIDKHKLFS